MKVSAKMSTKSPKTRSRSKSSNVAMENPYPHIKNWDVTRWVLTNQAEQYPSDLSRLLAITVAMSYHHKKGMAFPTQAELAAAMGKSERTIMRLIGEMRAAGDGQLWEILTAHERGPVRKGRKSKAAKEPEKRNYFRPLFLDAIHADKESKTSTKSSDIEESTDAPF